MPVQQQQQDDQQKLYLSKTRTTTMLSTSAPPITSSSQSHVRKGGSHVRKSRKTRKSSSRKSSKNQLADGDHRETSSNSRRKSPNSGKRQKSPNSRKRQKSPHSRKRRKSPNSTKRRSRKVQLAEVDATSEASEEERPGAYRVSTHSTDRVMPSISPKVSTLTGDDSFAVPEDNTVTTLSMNTSTMVGAEVARDMTEAIEAAREQGRAEAYRNEGVVVAVTQTPRPKVTAARANNRKKRLALIAFFLCLLFLLITFGVAGYFLLNRQEEIENSSATNSTGNHSSVGNSDSELDAVISFDPPTAEDCAAVANGTDVAGQEDMITQYIDMYIEITTKSDEDADLLLWLLKQQVQLNLIPYIIGCHDVVGNVIGNGIVESVSNETSTCLFQNNPLCLEVILTVKIYLRRMEDGTTVIELLSEVLLEEDLTQQLELPPTVQTAGVSRILPTDFATGVPTEISSWSPSTANKDTTSPTETVPTTSPTLAPSPSRTATDRPPTKKPTFTPTNTPSQYPSSRPTRILTPNPTAIPTEERIAGVPTSAAPSMLRSSLPSTTPTSTPSSILSIAPTSLPSSFPSTTPTNVPSSLPSVSQRPSDTPSFEPTVWTCPLLISDLLSEFGRVHTASYEWVSQTDTFLRSETDLGLWRDRYALAVFYNELSPAGTGWLSTSNSVCDWDGAVSCDTNGRITRLALAGAGLIGTLPVEVGAISEMTNLDLSNNQLAGSLPGDQWQSMGNLHTLKLTNNELVGWLPSEWGTMTSLRLLHLDSNDLAGSLPSEWGTMTSLVAFHGTSNQLTGSLPVEWEGLVNLERLKLGSNNLAGNLPSEWASLTKLRDLSLGSNNFVGSLPPEWSSMNRMRYLAIPNNVLMGGEMPSEWSTMTGLQTLFLHDIGLFGSVPSSWVAMTSLQSLRLHRNKLEGTVPSWLGTATSQCTLHHNCFADTSAVVGSACDDNLGEQSECT